MKRIFASSKIRLDTLEDTRRYRTVDTHFCQMRDLTSEPLFSFRILQSSVHPPSMAILGAGDGPGDGDGEG